MSVVAPAIVGLFAPTELAGTNSNTWKWEETAVSNPKRRAHSLLDQLVAGTTTHFSVAGLHTT